MRVLQVLSHEVRDLTAQCVICETRVIHRLLTPDCTPFIFSDGVIVADGKRKQFYFGVRLGEETIALYPHEHQRQVEI